MSKLKAFSLITIGQRHFNSTALRNTSNVLVVNCGSSTVKFQVVNPNTNKVLTNGLVDRIGTEDAVMKWKHDGQKDKTVEKLMGNNVTNHFGAAFEKIARQA